MNFIIWLNQLAKARLEVYGAPITLFGIFGVINYPLSYIFHNSNHSYESFYFRTINIILCLLLALNYYWPKKYQKFIPLYWFITILFCLPYMGSYLLFMNNFQNNWLMNIALGLFLLMLIVDWLLFLILLVIGSILGYVTFLYFSGHLYFDNTPEQINLALYLYALTILIGGMFSRNKYSFQLKQKENLDLISLTNIELEEKIQERTIELKRALAAKTEFLNNISHEIRTPVQGFTAISEGLVDNWQQFDEQKRYHLAQVVSSNAQRLASLLGGILDLSKYHAGKMRMFFSSVNLNLVIKNIIDEAENLYIQDKPIKIYFNTKHEITLNADSERISQLFRNILINAIKYTKGPGDITITQNKEGKSVHIMITDEGVGIPEEELEAVFQPFTQSTRTNTKAGGTGLGLAIAREIVQGHNGKICAENNENKGSKFHILLPLLKARKLK